MFNSLIWFINFIYRYIIIMHKRIQKSFASTEIIIEDKVRDVRTQRFLAYVENINNGYVLNLHLELYLRFT